MTNVVPDCGWCNKTLGKVLSGGNGKPYYVAFTVEHIKQDIDGEEQVIASVECGQCKSKHLVFIDETEHQLTFVCLDGDLLQDEVI